VGLHASYVGAAIIKPARPSGGRNLPGAGG
jgi:hypothetical protein